jgi:nitrogen regulatory protein PII
MAKLVMLITSRVDQGHAVGEAWEQAGAPGITFVESYGLRRLRERARSAEVLPGIMSMLQILRENEETSLIVLSVVDNDALVEKLVEATNAVLGDLMQPNTGVMFIIDVERAIGVRDHRQR